MFSYLFLGGDSNDICVGTWCGLLQLRNPAVFVNFACVVSCAVRSRQYKLLTITNCFELYSLLKWLTEAPVLYLT